MPQKSRPDNLFDALKERFPLPWYWLTAVVAVVLLLLVVLVAYLEGVFTHGAGWRFWQIGLLPPVIIIYILVVYPVLSPLFTRAVEAFRPLLPEGEDFDELAAGIHQRQRRWECAAMAAGAAVWVGVSMPWAWVHQPLEVYGTVMDVVMFGLLGWLIYVSLAGNVGLARLSRRQLNLDIFDTGVLSPVAQWSLGTSLAFLGGITVSAAFQPLESLLMWQSIMIYAILVLAAVLVFFLSMWSTHSAMAGVKRSELEVARKHLAAASRELKDRVALDRMEGIEGLSAALSAWATFERRVQEVPAWPFNLGTIRRLTVSLPIPGIVYAVKFILGG